jgi:hypothetical protein
VSNQPTKPAESKPINQHAGRWKLFAVLAVCAAPMILSYFYYYVVKPEGRTNYGALIDPRNYPIPPLGSVALDGKPAALEDYKGKWIMLQIDGGECAEPCRQKLFTMRQLRLTTGKDRDRVERVWAILDDKPLDTVLMREYDGTRLLRVKPEAIKAWLPVETGTSVTDHIYMIDPLGNLMMRFPKDPDPNRMKKDLQRLLKASKIG